MKLDEKAAELHAGGCNCAQSVLGACSGICGLDEETAKGVGAGFGGGMGCGEICGAVAGGVMAIGCAFAGGGQKGSSDAAKVKTLRTELVEGVRQKFGAVTCRELKTPGKAVPCGELIGYCAKTAGDIIDNNK